MATSAVTKLGSTVLKGLVVGVCATQALDWLSEVLYAKERKRSFAREVIARRGTQAYEVAVAKIARGAGATLTRRQRRVWGWRFHKAFGLLGGLGYMAIRRTNPKIGIANGLAYGVGFFLVADELLMPLLGLTPGPRAFPWRTHARGAASHIAYGIASESAARVLERIAPATSAQPAY